MVSWRQLWYDDVDAFGAKVGFALGKGLRGVGIWALGYQGMRPELWSVLRLLVEGAQRFHAAVRECDPGRREHRR